MTARQHELSNSDLIALSNELDQIWNDTSLENDLRDRFVMYTCIQVIGQNQSIDASEDGAYEYLESLFSVAYWRKFEYAIALNFGYFPEQGSGSEPVVALWKKQALYDFLTENNPEGSLL